MKIWTKVIIFFSLIWFIINLYSPWIWIEYSPLSAFRNGEYLQMILNSILIIFLHWDFFHFFWNSIILIWLSPKIEEYLWEENFIISFFSYTIIQWLILSIFWIYWIWISGFAIAVLTYYTLLLYRRKDEQYKAGILFLIIMVFFQLWWFIWHITGLLFWIIWYFYNFYILKK